MPKLWEKEWQNTTTVVAHANAAAQHRGYSDA
jgi:hypothetical protein